MRQFFGKLVLTCTAIAAFAVGAGVVFADTIDINYTSPVDIGGDGSSGVAVLTATNEGGGEWYATAGTLVLSGGTNPYENITFTLFSNPNGSPTNAYSPSGYFIYDNAVFPATNPPVDNSGLLFTGGGLEVNIFSNSNTFYVNSGYNVPIVFTVAAPAAAPVPEPSSLALLGVGGIGLAIGAFRRRRAAA
jgi:hypothetical protein